MVTATEANFNRHLDEAKIKQMTGGEPINARFMRQNWFQFEPGFKLWLVANDRPRVRGTDQAFWRRVRVIPLTTEIPLAERDLDLPSQAPSGVARYLGLGGSRLPQMATRRIDPAQRRGISHQGLATGDGPPEKIYCRASGSRPWLQDRRVPVTRPLWNWSVQHGEQTLTVQDFKAKLQESLDVTHTRVKGRSWWRGIKFRD